METIVYIGIGVVLLVGAAIAGVLIYRNNRDNVEEAYEDLKDELERAKDRVWGLYEQVRKNVQQKSRQELERIRADAQKVLNSSKDQGHEVLHRAQVVLDEVNAELQKRIKK